MTTNINTNDMGMKRKAYLMKKAGLSVLLSGLLAVVCTGCRVQIGEGAENTAANNLPVETEDPGNTDIPAQDASTAVEYDMYGFVVDKLPTEEYYNHYNVKGDNDVIYICNYNGEDELAEGTYVGMWQIGDGWTLEVIGDNEAKEQDLSAAFADSTQIGIGTTGYYITIPASYYESDVTEEDRRDDMIAYYKSDEFLMDFDLYQFAANGKTLDEYTKEEMKEYGATEYKNFTVNELELTRYESEETYDNTDYKVANYLFAAGDDFGEIVFWLDGDEAEGIVQEIISSITLKPVSDAPEGNASGK